MGEKEWEQTMSLRLALTAKLSEHEQYMKGYLSGIQYAVSRMRIKDTIQEVQLRVMRDREIFEADRYVNDADRGEHYKGYVAALTYALELIRTMKGP